MIYQGHIVDVVSREIFDGYGLYGPARDPQSQVDRPSSDGHFEHETHPGS